jgi:hypothetical protein
MICRILRLDTVAGLGLALAALSAGAQQTATQTALTVQTSEQSGRTQATASVTVNGANGEPAGGIVTIEDEAGSRQLAQAVLNSDGQATLEFGLAGGNHALRALYAGDALHQTSTSRATQVSGQASSTPTFSLSLAAVTPSTLPLTLSPGASGTLAVTITPEDNAALTAPMFITLSCSGLPSLASCTFTPETIEILATTPATCASGSPASACPPVSSMLVQTVELQTKRGAPSGRPARSNPIAWAFLLPGVLGLGGLAWGARRRRWLQRLSLVALVGLITTLGATACRPLYNYYENGPAHPPDTPAGTYTVTVTGQSTNGVAAITNSTTMVLTVQ